MRVNDFNGMYYCDNKECPKYGHFKSSQPNN